MKTNFAKCLTEILRHEGGWADHPKDPGGATMRGITIGTYRQWKGRAVTKAELRAISDAEVAAIYKRNYWDKVRGDDLPAGLDLVAFDAAVNSGPARGARWLQTALGVAADGKVGTKTVEAALAADTAATINRALDVRLSFLMGLQTWPTFGKGWARRVAEVRAKALALLRGGVADLTPISGVKPRPRPAAPPQAPASPVPATPAAPTPTKPLLGAALVAAGAALWSKWGEFTEWLSTWF